MPSREYWRRLHFLSGVEAESVDGMTPLVDEFIQHVACLVKLQEPVDTWDTPLSNMLLMKHDSKTILAWNKYSVQCKRDKYSELIEFLQDRNRILKSSKCCSGQGGRRTSFSCITEIEHKRCCSALVQFYCPTTCELSVTVYGISSVTYETAAIQRDIVKTTGLCWSCLSSSHSVKSCKSDYSCQSCHEHHHSFLHRSSQTKVTLAVISESLALKLLTPHTKVNFYIDDIAKVVQQVKGSITAN
uniref:Uncharacterized protein n=1 Tax=Anopheles christyi TaxID=43041 RepID=A0A182JWJ0_9DIPT